MANTSQATSAEDSETLRSKMDFKDLKLYDALIKAYINLVTGATGETATTLNSFASEQAKRVVEAQTAADEAEASAKEAAESIKSLSENATAAANSATAAANSATAAANSASEAAGSALTAANSVTNILDSETNVLNNAAAAATSATNAANSEKNASNYANNALSSEKNASSYANNASNYANNASLSAINAASSEISAAASALAAAECVENSVQNTKQYLNIHPENSPVIIPFINNDMAFLLKRGGECEVRYDGVVQDVDVSNVFDGSPSYWVQDPTGITKIIFTITLPQVYTWTNTIYFDFGSSSWRAISVKIEVINTKYDEDVWTEKFSTAVQTAGNGFVTFTHRPEGAITQGETGFNKIRFTFSNWNNSTIFRISQLGLYNYGSVGARMPYMSRGIDDYLYRNITPNENEIYDLGSKSRKWANIYAKTFIGDVDGNSKNVTDTVLIEHGGTGATTAEGALNAIGAAAANHAHNYLPLSGGVMTGQIKTSFKNSIAIGSYAPSSNTIPDLLEELRYSSGCMGSVSITTAYTMTAGGTISTGWYNFLYIPHRSGGLNGAASGDNCSYGTLVLYGMTVGSRAHYIIRYASTSVAESYSVESFDYSGQGASGIYCLRFANGLQICWNIFIENEGTGRYVSWTFSKPFLDEGDGCVSGYATNCKEGTCSISSTGMSFYLPADAEVYGFAIGKWK